MIPTLRDLARMRFRVSWLGLMAEIMAARLAAGASEAPRDLFDLLTAARDPETGAAFSHAKLRDQVTTMVVTGNETTALALFWSSYLLASAPAEQVLRLGLGDRADGVPFSLANPAGSPGKPVFGFFVPNIEKSKRACG